MDIELIKYTYMFSNFNFSIFSYNNFKYEKIILFNILLLLLSKTNRNLNILLKSYINNNPSKKYKFN